MPLVPETAPRPGAPCGLTDPSAGDGGRSGRRILNALRCRRDRNGGRNKIDEPLKTQTPRREKQDTTGIWIKHCGNSNEPPLSFRIGGIYIICYNEDMNLTTLLVVAALDLGEVFSAPDAWRASAVDFTVAHAADGFKFADAKRRSAVSMGRGKCVWHGLDIWECRVYYDAAGATRLEMSLYNRGDDREGLGLGPRQLDDLLGKIESALGPAAKRGRPAKRKLRAGSFQNRLAWAKSDPPAEVVWGVSHADGTRPQIDFMRLSLVRPGGKARPKGAAKSVSGNAARAKAKANLAKNDEGDVWIKNVPMVDQGQKGYCAAAVAERVLRYYGHDVDEHEVAQIAGTTSEGGTSDREMTRTVQDMGSRYRLGYGEIVSLSDSLEAVDDDIDAYNKSAKALRQPALSRAEFTRGNRVYVGEIYAAMKPHVLKRARTKDSRYKKFLSGVKRQVSQGIPVFWSVTLGLYPEPEIPQASGGHMRLIIGYNEKTKEILYTDTWGAGHELKRMPADWAFAITHSAFYLRPL